jgi:transcriptional regulator with XRE-family HTH domain
MFDMGERLKKLRKSRGLSQEQLAKTLKVTKSMISDYENSMRLPPHNVILMLATIFNVSIDYLYGLSDRRTLDVTGLSEEKINVLSLTITFFKSDI